MSIIPGTREAEAGESLEPKKKGGGFSGDRTIVFQPGQQENSVVPPPKKESPKGQMP